MPNTAKILAILSFMLLSLAACTQSSVSPITGTPTRHGMDVPTISNTNISAEETGPIRVPILHHTVNVNHGVLEAAHGAYLAAWLAPGANIRDFQQLTGRDHAAFVYEMHLNDSLPTSWILQCIAARATPILMVNQPNNSSDYNDIWGYITELAQSIGAFNLPMFVAFLPPGHNIPATEYSIIYRYARSVFLHYAPHAAFVWVAPDTNATPHNAFFPGHDAIDWVAVPLFSTHSAGSFNNTAIENFTTFYSEFSNFHPIMVLPLGVSNFTRNTHLHHVPCAAKEIARMYGALRSFPRVGLIAYADAFCIRHTTQYDFSISIEPALVYAYSEATSHFLSYVQRNTPPGPGFTRSLSYALLWDSDIYVDTQALAEVGLPVPRITLELGEHIFTHSRNITSSSVEFCEVRQAVVIGASRNHYAP